MFPKVRKRIAEMAGKHDTWFTRKVIGLFNTEAPSVDYTRNDYDLFQSIYWASEMPTPDSTNKIGAEYQLAASMAKPIINSATAFIVGSGYKVDLGTQLITENQKETVTEKINEWLEENQHNQLELTKFGLRDGDSYLYINDMLDAEMLDPRTVEVILDAMTNEQIGYDVTETVEEIMGDNTTQSVRYIKKYRKSRLEIYRLEQNEKIDETKLYYAEIYTTGGKVVLYNQGVVPEDLETDDAGNVVVFDEIVERPLPIVAIHNEHEPRAVYGNSELQNILIQFRNYSGVLEESTKNVIYNGSPIFTVRGAEKEELEDETDEEGNKRVNLGADNILFLTGDNAEAKFVTTQSIMGDSGKLLEIYFYLILEGSETPEFVFGAAVQSSKASVSEQMPIVVLKANRKRTEFTSSIKHMIDIVIDRKISLSDPDFFPLQGIDPKVKVLFPDITDEDGALTKETIDMLLTNGIISNKTALKLSAVGNKIADIDKEISDAKADSKEALENSAITPDVIPDEPTVDDPVEDDPNGDTE